MENKQALDELVQKQYKELSAQLGDCHFQIKKFKDQIVEIEKNIEKLNSGYPLALASLAKVELESKDDEQS